MSAAMPPSSPARAPTVLALCDGVQAAEHAAEAARALTADGAAAWRVLVPSVAVDGVRVESLHHG
ncbi:hypothetical protein GY12_16840 [Micrococcus luteus]|nr:hypothetical protein GY12_16840 [Micrococcus luteus]